MSCSQATHPASGIPTVFDHTPGKPGWPLTADEQKHLAEFSRVYCLPEVMPEYRAIAQVGLPYRNSIGKSPVSDPKPGFFIGKYPTDRLDVDQKIFPS